MLMCVQWQEKLSDENEEAAFNAVSQVLSEALRRHPKTLDEDKAILDAATTSATQRLLVSLRRREKEILMQQQRELQRRWRVMWAPDEPPPLLGEEPGVGVTPPRDDL
jgi:hypothetical protein